MLGGKLRPGLKSLAVAQDRAEEKAFIECTGARVAPWRSVASLEDVDRAVAELGMPVVLKTRRYGYDGKGQAWIRSADEAEAAWDAIGGEPAVAEAGVDFAAEFSVIVARWADGRTTFWDSPDNVHRDGILRTSTVPRRPVVAAQVEEARTAAAAIAEALGHVGVLTVEFFASRRRPGRQRDRAARPQQRPLDHRGRLHFAVRAAHPRHLRPSARLDRARRIVGLDGQSDRRRDRRLGGLLADPHAHVHLYGKGEARPGRKMGHVTRLTLRGCAMKIIGSFVSPYVRKVLGVHAPQGPRLRDRPDHALLRQ